MSFQSELKAGADAVQPRLYPEQSSRPIHVTHDMIGSPVPTQTVHYRAGLQYDMPHHLADVFVENGWGVECPLGTEPPEDSLEATPGVAPERESLGDTEPETLPAPFGKPGIPVLATNGEERLEFKSVGAAAKALGVNRKALHRALASGTEVSGWKIERIEFTEG